MNRSATGEKACCARSWALNSTGKQNADGRAGAKAIGVFGYDQETVGSGHGSEIARTLPGNERDLRHGTCISAGGGEKAGQAGFRFDVFSETRESEVRTEHFSPGKSGHKRRGEEQKGDGGGHGIARQAEALRAVLAALRADLVLNRIC